MIIFECPHCGEEMEVSDRKIGRWVDCVECRETIEVRERPAKRARIRTTGDDPNALSPLEYALYGIGFLLFPFANVFISSILYFVWKEDRPTKAYQINQMGWIIFAVQLLPMLGLCILGRMIAGRR